MNGIQIKENHVKNVPTKLQKKRYMMFGREHISRSYTQTHFATEAGEQ